MSRHFVEKPWASRNLYLDQGELLLLLEEPIKPMVTARTRHGRNIRIPLSILSKTSINFNCQLCGHPAFPDYTSYTSHLIQAHFHDQLVAGLDNTGCKGGLPSCPFPVCSGTLWASLEALLMHYASHHHVIEKLMMFESEQKCLQYRTNLEVSEERILEMKAENSELQKQLEETKQRLSEQILKAEEKAKKEECPPPDLKTMIKQENAALTNIENQTLKMECLQLKVEKDKLEKVVEARTKELEACKTEMKNTTEEMSKDQKHTVDMCKQWKEVCLAEEAKHEKEVDALKADLSNCKKEILNLKNIIEIGKSTVEHAKQLSVDLAKDNKKRQLKEEEYEQYIVSNKAKIKVLEAENSKYKHEVDNLNQLVRFQNSEMDNKAKQDVQIVEDYRDMSSKYQSLMEVVKQRDSEIENMRKSLEREAVAKASLEAGLKKALVDKQTQHESLATTNKELEEKKRELRSIFVDFDHTRVEKEEVEKQLVEVRSQDIRYKQELVELRKEVEVLRTEVSGHQNLKTLYDNLQTKLQEERAMREADEEAARKTFESEMSQMREELSKYLVEQEQDRKSMQDQEVSLRMKSAYISQLLDEAKTNKSGLDKLEEMAGRLAAKTRQEEEQRKKNEKMTAEIKVYEWEILNYKQKLVSFEMIIADMRESERCKGAVSPPTAHDLNLMIVNNNLNPSTTTTNANETDTTSWSLSGCSSKEDDYSQQEYSENQEGSLNLNPRPQIKIEITDDVDEKDVIAEQRDGETSGGTRAVEVATAAISSGKRMAADNQGPGTAPSADSSEPSKKLKRC